MSEMVERVARAMAAAIVNQPRSGATFDEVPALMIADEDSNSFWELLPVARAAIAAMREPTEAMQDEAWKLFDNADENPRLVWRAMIAAALEPAGAEAPAE